MNNNDIDFNSIVLPGGKLQGMTIPQAWYSDKEEFLRLLKFTPTTDTAKSIQPIMRVYAEIMSANEMPKPVGTVASGPISSYNASNMKMQSEHNVYTSQSGPQMQPTNEYTQDSQRYINQIGVVRHSNGDKTRCTTLAVDASIKKKIFDEGTVSPLEIVDDTSRFKFILIDKQKAATIIRKANIPLESLMFLEAQYRACIQLDIFRRFGVQLATTDRITLYDKDYAYMSDPKGKRYYHLIINFTIGNNSPFYIGISNKLEGSNGEKEDLKTGYCNLTSEEFGYFLDEMISFKRNFTTLTFGEALDNAKAGGYKDRMKIPN